MRRLLPSNVDIRELLTKSASFFVIKCIGFLSGYIFTLLIARIYGAKVNGFVAIAFSIFLIGSLVPKLGFDINLVKIFSSKGIGEAKTYYRKSLLISLPIAIILALTGIFFKENFAGIFGVTDSDVVSMGFISIPFWVYVLINSAVLRGLKHTEWFSFLSNAGRFVFGALILLVLYYGFNLKLESVPIMGHTIGLFLLGILSFFLVNKKLKKAKAGIETFSTRDYIVDSAPLMFSSALILLLGWTDTIFLAFFETAEDVGIYHVVLKVAVIIGFSLQSLNSILAPKISKAYANNEKVLFDSLLRTAVKVNFYFSICILIALIALRNPILGLFGSEFVSGSSLLVLLCFGQLTNAICGPVGVVFQMTGQQKVFQNLVLIAFVMNLLLNIFLIPLFGIYGAAISSIVSMSFWNIAGVVIIYKKHKILLVYSPLR